MRLRAAFVVFLCLGVNGCATPQRSDISASIQPGERPDISTDEAGLWMASEDVEQRLVSSGRVVTDAEINDYVKGIICRLSPDYCEDIRFYIVRTPHFNASMYPNGFMQVWTGLILRAENEAQLAYVLGHELGHYLQRHGIKQWRAVRGTSSAMTFFQVATAAAGVGFVGDIGALIAMGAVMSYSRDFEREADDAGFEMLVKAGYDPDEAPKIWEALLKERDASDDPKQFIFFATHPSTEERIDTLKALAAAAPASTRNLDVGEERYARITRPYLGEWLRDDLRNRKLAGSEVMLKRLIENRDERPEFQFFLGELYRIRADEGDAERAVENYTAVLSQPGAPAEAYRSLGLVHWREGRTADARAAFEAYLRAVPEASDHAMVKSYLDQL
ncbi:MAG TPA: M48 family metalloprotease, partial [Gammaproteobacteria bacterium]|nr:M48 family metalloprotease [Gammaproteobacteria bacterium]